MKTNDVAMVAAPGSRYKGKCGMVVDVKGLFDCTVWLFLDGKRRRFKESDVVKIPAPRFKKGARVRIHGWHKDQEGKLGTVASSYTKWGEPKCWVYIDGVGGGMTGVPRVYLALVTTARKGRHLPPDPEGRNGERREWAKAALDGFMAVCRTDRGDALPDLLCNLAHLCDETGEDFASCLRRARMHYRDETGGKGKQCFLIGIPTICAS